jgi:transcriptional regulator with XRE-family HTH domain
MQIGQRIRELREKLGLSQRDVERATGMRRTYLSTVECGHTVPSLENIERFAVALGLPIHEMFRDVSGDGGEQMNGKDEGLFLALLSDYVHKMDAADRQLLMTLARWFSRRK